MDKTKHQIEVPTVVQRKTKRIKSFRCCWTSKSACTSLRAGGPREAKTSEGGGTTFRLKSPSSDLPDIIILHSWESILPGSGLLARSAQDIYGVTTACNYSRIRTVSRSSATIQIFDRTTSPGLLLRALCMALHVRTYCD